MGSDKTQIDWLEPGWSIVVRKRSFRHIFISKGGGRWLKLAAIPYLLFLAAAYILGVMELAQNRKVIFLATGMLIGFPFALTAMEYLFQFLKLPRGILVQAGFVVIDGQYFPGELAQIETDPSGHRWLIVRNRFERIRIGIDESLSVASVLAALNRASEAA